MRTLITATKSRTTFVHRIFLIACVAVAAISASTFVTVGQGEDPPGGTGSVGVAITYFGALSTGPDKWFVDGTIQAQNMSDVSIVFGHGASGTVTPDAYGYFSKHVSAPGGVIVTIDVSDSTSTEHAQITLEDYTL